MNRVRPANGRKDEQNCGDQQAVALEEGFEGCGGHGKKMMLERETLS
jgi:hypothetical protein